ncbi:MAG: hypothetical protein D6773_18105 [Alphaproteobacteria bacterium]|nr:MAG: hypothetical protein D6773_18105 [Alphaproteobacteria bacterium]
MLLTALFLPLAPAVFTLYLMLARLALACPAALSQSCLRAGVDVNALHESASRLLQNTADLSAGPALFVYLLFICTLAQFTTRGLRGRLVRSCAVTMVTGLMPLFLHLAAELLHEPGRLCPAASCDPFTLTHAVAQCARMVFAWLAQIAVPLAVLTAALVVLTLGYALLLSRMLALAEPAQRAVSLALRGLSSGGRGHPSRLTAHTGTVSNPEDSELHEQKQDARGT